MYIKFDYMNNAGDVVRFLMDIASPAYMALTAVNYEIVNASTDRDRMEANQAWPSFTYYKRMLIHMEVDILAETPEDFHTFWHDALQKIMVPPTTLQTVRKQGTLFMRPAGVTEDWTTDVVVDSPPGIPRAGLGPSAGKMTVTFKSFNPWWHRVTTGDNVWHV